MANLITFPDLASAIRAGFQVYDRTTDGVLVRSVNAAGTMTIALVSST